VTQAAILVLEDGTVFEGESVGAPGLSVGEVVFNTAMTGYQEVLTDPSYARQMVTLTYPHIGNTGMTDQDDEAHKVWSAGLIVRDVPRRPSNWRSQVSLQDWLLQRGVVAISGIDTRKLTRILRERGAQNGALMAGEGLNVETALEAARKFPGLKGMDLAKVVSTDKAYPWTEGQLDLDSNEFVSAAPRFKVVAYDFGAKLNILRMLAERGCDITVVAAQTPAADVLAMNPACSCPTARATRNRATTRSRRSRCSWTRSCRCSASAWATSCWRWPPAPRRSRWATATTARTTRCRTWTMAG